MKSCRSSPPGGAGLPAQGTGLPSPRGSPCGWRRGTREAGRTGGWRQKETGYTLLELLMAMGLLVFLGAGLVSLLGYAVSTWHTAENRGRVYDTARAVLERVAEDLRSVVVRSHAAEGDSWVRFIADTDPAGRQRLRLVRSTSGEAADAILREGGRYLLARTPAVVDGAGDAREASAGLLAAPAGLMEVLYAADARPGRRIVWRGARSPVGGPDSLFVDRNIEPEAVPRLSVRSKTAPAKDADPAGVAHAAAETVEEGAEESHLARVAAPIAENVIYLGFRFWTPMTNSWREAPTLRAPKPGEPSGPSPLWDSTRALLDVRGAANEWFWQRREGSLDDPRDDIFPERVEITVVIGEPGAGLGTRLVDDLPEGGMALTLSQAFALPEDPGDRYLLVEGEWLRIEAADGPRLGVAPKGRGARGTKAAKHERGARVEAGSTFRRLIEVPGFRREIDLGDEAPQRSRRTRR